MKNEIKNKRGRPQKLSQSEKHVIIDRFLELEANSDVRKLKAYNIYAQLAAFANEMHWQGANGETITTKDFQDNETRAYIENLIANADLMAKTSLVRPPVYVPLAIAEFSAKPVSEMIQIVKERESHFEQVCVTAGTIYRLCLDQQTALNDSRNETALLELDRKNLLVAAQEMQAEIKSKQAEIQDLKRMLRKQSDDIAANSFAAMPKRKPKEHTLTKISHEPLFKPLEEKTIKSDKAQTGNILQIDENMFCNYNKEGD